MKHKLKELLTIFNSVETTDVTTGQVTTFDLKVLGKIYGMYRVGDILISMNDENPSEKYEGEWELLEPGKTIVCIDTANNNFNPIGHVGGSINHTLTTEEMPSHTHTQYGHNHSQEKHGHSGSADTAGWHGHSGFANNAGAHTHEFYHNNNDNVSGKKYVSASAYLPTSPENWIMMSAGAHTHSLSINGEGSHTHSLSVGSATPIINSTVATNQSTGGSKPHSNLQPFVVVYMWIRVK